MEDKRRPDPTLEHQPNSADIHVLEERIYEFNVQATGISDGQRFATFLRGPDGTVIGGIDGWTWGGTCFISHLFVPAQMRKQGHGTRLMRRIEEEATARGCDKVVVGTHDFQAPDFYRKLGFRFTGAVEGYPRGHQYLTFVKEIGVHAPSAGPA